MLYPDYEELIELRARAASLMIGGRNKVKSSMSGDYLSAFRGHGMEFDEVRKYVPGDDIRKIDWRITARVGVPHIKLFKEERQLNLLLCTDVNSYMRFGTRGTFKSIQAARCASIIGWCANANNDSVGAYLFGDIHERELFFRPKKSRQSLWNMIQTLVRQEEKVTSDTVRLTEAAEFLQKSIRPGSLVFFISDFINIDDEFAQQISYLARKSQLVFIAVNDPADKEIPPAGNILFAAGDTEKVHIGTDGLLGREKYYQQWLGNRALLEEITANLGIKMIQLYTDEDIFYKLLLGLR